MLSSKARVIAFYLPQFHPIPENNEWWGPGFTEWVNVGKAKPLFKGHAQPRIPADLGYYDLRLPETREAQALLASEAGIEGFCYYHYWFGNGKMLLQRPFEEVLRSGSPDFPFCLCWANHSWTSKTWDKDSGNKAPTILYEQQYPGENDIINHFNYLLPAFKDKRYMRVDGKPLFVVFAPLMIPNMSDFIEMWNKMAKNNGLSGIYFIGICSNGSIRGENGKVKLKGNTNNVGMKYNQILNLGFDAICSDGKIRAELKCKSALSSIIHAGLTKIGFPIHNTYEQAKINENLYTVEDSWENVYPSIIPNWDRSPRSKTASIYMNSTPEVFKDNINDALSLVEKRPYEHRILFLKSWNEWGEGNYVEPDYLYGNGYLNVLRENLS